MIKEEVVKIYGMIKDSGYEVVDVIFEGAMTVKKKELISQIEELAEQKKAMGVIRIIYTPGENRIRTIEIPVGEGPVEEGEA